MGSLGWWRVRRGMNSRSLEGYPFGRDANRKIIPEVRVLRGTGFVSCMQPAQSKTTAPEVCPCLLLQSALFCPFVPPSQRVLPGDRLPDSRR
jgi:hypothetical protein